MRSSSFERLDDTIVAVSSPPGRGVRGIIRLSGPESLAMAAAVFVSSDGHPLTEVPGHRRVNGRVRLDEDAGIPGEIYVFRAPASYTRQDVVEIHTLGAPAVLAMVFDRLTQAGARPAEPGEFTARAFFAGALDLTRVEGVAAVIQARNDAQLRAAGALLHGGLSRRSAELRERLAELLALIEAEIDFVEESITFVSKEQVAATLDAVAADVDALMRNAPSVERLGMLPEIVLIGRPNAGKSTLFNRLTGMDRAIASATAGTTRDVLSAPVRLPGGEAMLSDLAGLVPATDQAGPLDVLADEAARRAIATADVHVLVVDATDSPGGALAALRSWLPYDPALVVLNKIDQLEATAIDNLARTLGTPEAVIAVSGLVGTGMDRIRERLAALALVETETHGTETLALSNRQRSALRDAADALQRARATCNEADEVSDIAELLAMEVREAANALSLLTGEVTTEDLLGRIFSSFCIGK